MKTLFALSLLLSAASVRAAEYKIDSGHSQVGFRIKHLVGRVPGRFRTFSGVVSYEPGSPKSWGVTAEIDPASIDTDNDKRDAHLRNEDFFDVAKCPEMKFKSTSVTAAGEGAAKLRGDLTMHCVTKPVELDLEIGGVTKDPWGNERAGFTARGKLARKDFGIEWNKTLDAGGVMLGDDVELTLDIEAVRDDGKGKPQKDAKKKT